MIPVLSPAQMRAADQAAASGLPEGTLVARAARAVAKEALARLGGAYGRRVVVVAGKGNNGEDGRVAAGLLAEAGVAAVVVPAPARNEPAPVLPRCDLVIDAAYGTGFSGSYTPPQTQAPVLAVDIPSGLDASTGAVEAQAVRARWTVTFAAYKPGLLLGHGRDLSGEVVVADIGVPPRGADCWLVEDGDIARLLPPRPSDGHKWDTACLVVAGSGGMTGAARLCAAGAMRSGAGMVRLAVPGAAESDLPSSEAVSLALAESGWIDTLASVMERVGCAVMGPGLAGSQAVASEVREMVAKRTCPVVLDATGLAAAGDIGGLAALVAQGADPVVITPHGGEYRRLVGQDIGVDRLGAARRLAEGTGATVLLKGSTTVVAEPGGRALLAATGSARLATAGSGDVLSGVIGAFIARGVEPFEAAGMAAHCHGRAAEMGYLEGLVAGDLPELIAGWLSGIMGGPAGGHRLGRPR